MLKSQDLYSDWMGENLLDELLLDFDYMSSLRRYIADANECLPTYHTLPSKDRGI